jgi:hypothetical protein
VKGSGVWAVYDEIIFTDGSALFFKSNGATTAEATKGSFKGTTTIIGGKGKYEGVKGDGIVSGARLQPLPDAGAELYADVTLNIKK